MALKTTNERNPISAQLKHLARPVLVVYIPAFAILVGVGLLRLFYDVPVGFFTRDPADLMRHDPISTFSFYEDGVVDLPFYLGAVSYIGILAWCATASICFLTVAVIGKSDRQPEARTFFLLAGVMSTLLLMDDLFRLHEVVFPEILNLSEYTLYAIYAGLGVYFLLRCRDMIAKTDYLLLLFAGGFLGLSLSVDVLTDTIFGWVAGGALFEDGLKFAGVIGWCMYFTLVSVKHLRLSTEAANTSVRDSGSDVQS